MVDKHTTMVSFVVISAFGGDIVIHLLVGVQTWCSKHALEGNAFRCQIRNLGKDGKIGSF
jgi:hypothetical protein